MKPEQQRVAIAELMGWKIEQQPCGEWSAYINGKKLHGRFIDKAGCIGARYPDYFNDLNDVADARRLLIAPDDYTRRVAFLNHLRSIRIKFQCGSPVSDYDLLNSTAGQQCEALVMAIGKWVEE